MEECGCELLWLCLIAFVHPEQVSCVIVDLLSSFSGFIVKTGDRHHIFKTTSVQSMW